MKLKKMTYPYFIWILIFILIPLLLVMVFAFSFGNSKDFETFTLSLRNFSRFFSPIYMRVLFKSLKLSLYSTLITLLLGYPAAFIISRAKIKTRNIIILLFVFPMWMNLLLRTYAWLTILGKNGIINNILIYFGFGAKDMLYREGAVLLGMVYNFLPFMVLPIYSVLIKMDNSLIEAAHDLGAKNLTVFRKIIFPLSLPGVVTGITMVFVPAVSTFVISSLLGGNKTPLIGNLIEQQFLVSGDWHFGSSMALVLTVIIFIFAYVTGKLEGGGSKERGVLW